MKVFAISGYSKSGKTTTGEALIKELSERRYKVRSVKDIHAESFCMDTPGSNTSRLMKAGSDMVVARGLYETDFLVPRRMGINEIADMLDKSAFGAEEGCDFLLIEGAHDEKIPRILTAKTTDEIDERLDKFVFVISGVVSGGINEYKGIKCVNALTDIKKLADFAEENALEWNKEYIIKRFNSKRNTVELSQINGEKYVTKKFSDRKALFSELFIREILNSHNINVPKLINITENCVKYEYIEGPLLIDILESGKINGFESAVKLLVLWLKDFYKALFNSMGAAWIHNDLQLRNFIVSCKGNSIFGLDFELCGPGDIEKDIVGLFIFISSYEPRFSEIRINQALCFLKEAAKLGLNPGLFFTYLPELWETIRKRRNLDKDINPPDELIRKAKEVLN